MGSDGEEGTDENDILCARSVWTFPKIVAEFQGKKLKERLTIH